MATCGKEGIIMSAQSVFNSDLEKEKEASASLKVKEQVSIVEQINKPFRERVRLCHILSLEMTLTKILQEYSEPKNSLVNLVSMDVCIRMLADNITYPLKLVYLLFGIIPNTWDTAGVRAVREEREKGVHPAELVSIIGNKVVIHMLEDEKRAYYNDLAQI